MSSTEKNKAYKERAEVGCGGYLTLVQCQKRSH